MNNMNKENAKMIDRFPEGVITPPPSKSLSHRALICAYLAGGEKALARIKNLGASDDIDATRRGVTRIVSPSEGADARVINCGESGSTLRFLIPLAGLDSEEWIFRGSGRLMDRPHDLYAEIFEAHGGCFEQRDGAVRVRGPLHPGRYALPGNVSSQFISGLLMALPLLDGDSEIALTTELQSADYVRLTADVMSAFGVRVVERGTGGDGVANFDRVTGYAVPGGVSYHPVRYRIESDWSQAAFFLCAGALGLRVSVDGLSPGSLQGDRRIVGVLKRAGADVDAEIRMFPRAEQGVFRALAPQSGLRAVTVDAADIPDLVPPIAALACYLDGESRIENAGRLRLKESDRLEALAVELNNLGADIRIEGDALIIRGKETLPGGRADAHGDHRIAMAVAVAATGCEGPVALTGWESVRKSYPNFWDDFEKSEKYESAEDADEREGRLE
jgi:3-phosphoshikimate 1-carboxyvinyltransferase